MSAAFLPSPAPDSLLHHSPPPHHYHTTQPPCHHPSPPPPTTALDYSIRATGPTPRTRTDARSHANTETRQDIWATATAERSPAQMSCIISNIVRAGVVVSWKGHGGVSRKGCTGFLIYRNCPAGVSIEIELKQAPVHARVCSAKYAGHAAHVLQRGQVVAARLVQQSPLHVRAQRPDRVITSRFIKIT